MTDTDTNTGTTTNVLNLVQDSLLRRMRTMHGLYHQAVRTMELELARGLVGLVGMTT